jgi:hypothetical protein
VVTLTQPTPAVVPTDTSVLFVAGVTTTQPTPVVQQVRSMDDYTATFGARSGPSAAVYDALDAYFHEGGSVAYVSAMKSTNVALADYQAALAALDKGLGPGQLLVPAVPVVAANIQSAALAHCAACNRVALFSVDPNKDKAGLLAAASALTSDVNASYGALFAPTVEVPGVTAGTTRQIGFAPIEAGIIARNDQTMNQDVAAAGDNGASLFALAIDPPPAPLSDQDYTDLNAGGVNMVRNRYGSIECYGYRSLVPLDPQWSQFGYARLRMAITADANQIGEAYVFSQIDGRGKTISRFAGELRAMLAGYYQAGALYGDTAEEAFQVKVAPPINTDATIANGELHAQLQVRMSPFAEYVLIQIVKVAITQALVAA